ncbi:MAG: hypothetical protein LBT46_15240 [Planctomycetaceae bacterium]|nr:hypothetical protein [Planctomycetaceae bacterium]
MTKIPSIEEQYEDGKETIICPKCKEKFDYSGSNEHYFLRDECPCCDCESDWDSDINSRKCVNCGNQCEDYLDIEQEPDCIALHKEQEERDEYWANREKSNV